MLKFCQSGYIFAKNKRIFKNPIKIGKFKFNLCVDKSG